MYLTPSTNTVFFWFMIQVSWSCCVTGALHVPNTTFNNISVILVEGAEVPGENDRSVSG
jgi:hypothetical protein